VPHLADQPIGKAASDQPDIGQTNVMSRERSDRSLLDIEWEVQTKPRASLSNHFHKRSFQPRFDAG
jgi:hypothetical protein